MPVDPTTLLQTTGIHPARRMDFDTLIAGIRNEIAQGFVSERTGPDGLTLYSYTIDCQFGNNWSVFSLISRGLVLDVANKVVVATSFIKFFNWSEISTTVPDEPFTVTTKVDGSLGILFRYKGKRYCITRGSFTSPQGQWAMKWLEEKFPEETSSMLFPEGWTFLFEIIYSENRIVISYPFEGLVLLAIYQPSGEEYDYFSLCSAGIALNLPVVEQHQFNTIEEMLAQAETLPHTSEGWVVKYQSGFRLKIKGSEYIRIHRLVSGVTPNRVWETLMNGDNPNDIVKHLPEELKHDFETITGIYTKKLNDLLAEVETAHNATKHMTDKECGIFLSSDYAKDSPARSFVFPARKMNFLTEVHIGGSAMRKKAFNAFKPKANILSGYQPSNAMNRFAAAAIE